MLTGIPVRRDVAMTGEITLRGRVLPIGGLKEKLLAALRAGITTVFIPKENEKDLAEIPDNVKKHLKLVPVAHVDEVIAQALARRPEPIEWEEPPETPVAPAGGGADAGVAAALRPAGGARTSARRRICGRAAVARVAAPASRRRKIRLRPRLPAAFVDVPENRPLVSAGARPADRPTRGGASQRRRTG